MSHFGPQWWRQYPRDGRRTNQTNVPWWLRPFHWGSEGEEEEGCTLYICSYFIVQKTLLPGALGHAFLQDRLRTAPLSTPPPPWPKICYRRMKTGYWELPGSFCDKSSKQLGLNSLTYKWIFFLNEGSDFKGDPDSNHWPLPLHLLFVIKLNWWHQCLELAAQCLPWWHYLSIISSWCPIGGLRLNLSVELLEIFVCLIIISLYYIISSH